MRYFLFSFFCLIFTIPSALASDAVPNARAILVLDASGSMWGQVDGKNKIVIARDVIADMMKDWDEGVHLGLSAYGHNSKSDCNDIETLVKVGPKTGKKIIKTVNDINPKGKTPLTAAVKKAAEELKYTEESATVILLSDGVETCDLDPCAVGKSLEEEGIDFTAHVIGFDVKVEDQKGLRCLAENTGGQFLSADNAGQLGEALKNIAEEVRSGADTVYVIVDKSGERYKKDVRYDVFAADDHGKVSGAAIHSTVDDFITIKAPGRYIVVAKVGQAVQGRQLIEVKEDETQEHEIDLRAGTFNLSGLVTDGKPIKKGDIYWYIKRYHDDGSLGEQVYSNVGRTATAELPPGKYRIEAKHYAAFTAVDIVSKAGEKTDLPVNFEAGYVKFLTKVRDEAPGGDVYYYIYPLDENGAKGAQRAADVGRNDAFWFTLDEGKYRLEARHGGYDNKTIDFEIKAGETLEVPVAFHSGE